VLSAGFGWRSAGSAEQHAVERADTAVLDVLTPICVEKFNQDAEAKANLRPCRTPPAGIKRTMSSSKAGQAFRAMAALRIALQKRVQAEFSRLIALSHLTNHQAGPTPPVLEAFSDDNKDPCDTQCLINGVIS
jgi:hypothetical protein